MDKIKEIAIDESFLTPSVRITAEIELKQHKEALISFSGQLVSDGEKIISNLSSFSLPSVTLMAENNAYVKTGTANIKKFEIVLHGELSNAAAEMLEDSRKNNVKRDVRGKVRISANIAESNLSTSHVHEIDLPWLGLGNKVPEVLSHLGTGTNEIKLLAYRFDSNYSTNRTNLWLLAAERANIVKISTRTIELSFEIKASDWINDFSPKIGLGKVLIIEVGRINDTFPEALEHLNNAEKSFLVWSTKGVYAECRELASLLDRKVKEFLGANSFAYKEKWRKAKDRFDALSSLDLHLEDIKNSKYNDGEVRIGKPDAENLMMNAKVLLKYASDLMKEGT